MLTVYRRSHGMTFGELQMRGCFVKRALHQMLRRVHQCKFGVGGAGPRGNACNSAWIVPGIAVERQAERMIGEQPGCIRPVVGGLRVTDRVDRLRVIGKPLRRQSVELRHIARHGPTQLQAEELPEQLVVSKPRALRVQRNDEGVGVLELEEQLLRTGVARS